MLFVVCIHAHMHTHAHIYTQIQIYTHKYKGSMDVCVHARVKEHCCEAFRPP